MRLIDADQIENRFVHWLGEISKDVTNGIYQGSESDGIAACFEEIREAPTVDLESLRPHGRWIFHHMTGSQAYYAHCSECRKLKHFASENDEKKERYCFWCGARMEEDKT